MPANKWDSTSTAILIVAVLIGLSLLAIAVLAYQLARPAQTLPSVNIESPAPVPSVTSMPVAAPVEATTRPDEPSANPISVTATSVAPVSGRLATGWPAPTPSGSASNLPTATVPVSTVSGLSAQPLPSGEYVHPTFEPTTEPCEACHHEYGKNAGGRPVQSP